METLNQNSNSKSHKKSSLNFDLFFPCAAFKTHSESCKERCPKTSVSNVSVLGNKKEEKSEMSWGLFESRLLCLAVDDC